MTTTTEVQGFDTTALVASSETAASALEAEKKAAVQARWIMALQRPRDWDAVRQDLLKECERPAFADAAIYNKPVGGGIEGLSIRFAEAAIRCLTNVLVETNTIVDNDEIRICRVSVTDLEANITYPQDVTIRKTVERRNPRGMEVVGERKNKQGQKVFIVKATEDDLLNKQNALISKALRTSALRIVPGDLLEEAERVCRQTQTAADAEDPDREMRRLIDGFAQVNVLVPDLKAYCGKELKKLSPAELEELRALWKALYNGDTTWEQAYEKKHPKPQGDTPEGKTETGKRDKATGGMAEKDGPPDDDAGDDLEMDKDMDGAERPKKSKKNSKKSTSKKAAAKADDKMVGPDDEDTKGSEPPFDDPPPADGPFVCCTHVSGTEPDALDQVVTLYRLDATEASVMANEILGKPIGQDELKDMLPTDRLSLAHEIGMRCASEKRQTYDE